MTAFHVAKPPVRQNLPQDPIRDPMFALPHQESYAGLFRQANKSYFTYFDEALLNSAQNALVFRNDAFIEELLMHRITPVMNLPLHTAVDDPDHPGQKSIADILDAIIHDIPRIKYIFLNSLSATWWGHGCTQLMWGGRRVRGNRWNSVVNHYQIHSDKLRFLSDGTPGIAIRTGADQYDDWENSFLNAYGDCILSTMLGMALFLKQPFLRDRFIIHMFNPSDSDWLYGLEREQSIYGLGLRSRLYWFQNLRFELLSWMMNALQRVGANGMIFGFYPEGNFEMQQQVLAAIKQLCTDNYAAFPVQGGQSGPQSAKGVLDRIEPAAVGYDVMMQLIEWCEGTMRRAFLGQDLSSVAKPTGIGAGAAQLQGDVRMDFVEYDAGLLAETLTEQLLSVILKYNRFIYEGKVYYGCDLPFSCRLEFQLSRDNVTEAIQAAQMLFSMGVELDADDLRKKAGLAPPKRKETTVSNPQIQQQHDQAKMMPGMINAGKRVDKFTKQIEKAARGGLERRNGVNGFAPPGGHHNRRREFAR